jgi:hypothetical protein
MDEIWLIAKKPSFALVYTPLALLPYLTLSCTVPYNAPCFIILLFNTRGRLYKKVIKVNYS